MVCEWIEIFLDEYIFVELNLFIEYWCVDFSMNN